MTTPTRQVERLRLVEQAEQARRDLQELEVQVASGEVDEATARWLRATYQEEINAAEDALAGLVEPEPDEEAPVRRSRGRMLIGAGIILVGLALAVGLVGQFVQARDDGPLQGVAATGEVDLDSVSNETMEAVIRSAETDPELAEQVQGMRFALAERYFSEGEFERAFQHYQVILQGSPPPQLGAATLTRVAWIVWVGNQETDLALRLLDRALEAVPSHPEASYVKGQVLWCGQGTPEQAIPLFERVLASEGLDQATRSQVESDLAAARAGEPCQR